MDPVTRAVAIGLLVVFVVAIVVLFVLRGDSHWDRLVYVFGGLEAIVFASAGALFGTTVQRGAVAAAKDATTQATAAAAQAQAEAKSAAVGATNGKALAAAVKAITGATSAGRGRSPDRPGGRPDSRLDDEEPGDPRLAALAQVASDLFPD